MLTLALHHDESVFVYLKEAGKGKHQIEQLGLFPSVFSFDQQFLYQKDAESSFRKMLKDILEVLSLKDEALYLSFSAQLCYFSFYENIPKDDIRKLVDKDIWLTKLKFGADFAERNECQVKALYKPDNRVSLICIYYPKLIREMISTACRELSCQAAGLGIHIFNISEVARLAVSEKEYVIAYFHRDMYEVMHIADDYVRGYARFSYVNGHFIYYDRNGHVPEAFNRGLAEQDTEILKDHAVYLSCSSEQRDRINALSEKGGNIHILNPMEIGSAAYSKPSAAYEKQYDTVFSSALGALI